jgi:prepilin-type N-terminal cleavage/methylation domain-containing protein
MNAATAIDSQGCAARKSSRAFTLAEMLVVLAIMALLGTLVAPSVLGLKSSGQMNQNLSKLSGLIEDARQYAIANDTYVWVAFAPATDSSGLKTLSVATLASADGTDPASTTATPWPSASYGPVPGANPSPSINLVTKVSILRQISLSDAGTFTSGQIPDLPTPPSPVSSTANSPALNGGGFFQVTLPAQATPVNFTTAVQFTPRGEARNGNNPVDLLELDLQPQKGNASQLDSSNVAVIRINGLTGEPVIYRP